MKQACINTYINGVNQDISNLKKQNDTYYSLLNGRRLTQDGNTSTAISNVIGNQELRYVDVLTNPQLGLAAGWVIVGHCMVRNDIVLFAKSQAGNSLIEIIKYNYTSNTYTTRIDLFDDTYKTAKLNFSNKIYAIGRYETEAVRHVYFVDGVQILRCINVAPDVDSTTGLIKNEFTSASYIGTQNKVVGQFDMLQDMTLSTPQFVQYANGNLYSGMIQYAYRLYNLNGSISMVSPTCSLIPLSDKITNGNTLSMFGNAPNINTGKSIIGTITLTASSLLFDRIEILALLYEQFDGIPTVKIVDKKTITRTGNTVTINFVDDGIYTLGSLLPEEVSTVKSLYIPKTIEEKDDRLFMGNIKENYFDISDEDFDARAYRYLNTVKSHIYQNSGTHYTLDGSGNWAYSAGGTGVDWTIPSTADCINQYNDIDNDTSPSFGAIYALMFQKDGSTTGGSGKNIEYEFDDSLCYMINESAANPDLFNTSLFSNTTVSVTGKINVGNSDWIRGSKRGFQRDEIYRFGIIFYDNKGRQSFVKWIGDIRMPNLIDSPHIIYENGSTYAVPLQVKFTVSNIPTNTDGTDMTYQIVNVKRGMNDRTVVFNGSFGFITHVTYEYPTLLGNNTTTPNVVYDEMLVFRSPDILYGNTIPETNLRFDTYNELKGVRGINDNVELWYDVNIVSTQYGSSIIQAMKVQPTTHNTDVIQFSNYRYINYSRPYYFGHDRPIGQNGTSLLIDRVTKDEVLFSDTAHRTFITNIRRSTIGYGGNTYNDRANNSYIAASDISNSGTVDTNRGDTFICYTDILEYQYDRTGSAGDYTNFVSYLPCETSVNLYLTQGYTYNKVYNTIGSNATYLNELDNSKLAGITYPYGDYYVYNNTYSTLDIAKTFFPRPFDFSISRTRDVMIRYSQTKLSGEEEDSWFKFMTNDWNEVDGLYGEITRLVNFKNEVYCFQYSGFVPLPINQQVLQTSDAGIITVLGTSSVLPTQFNYNIGSTQIGLQRDNVVVQSLSAMYWVDTNKQKLYKFNGQVETLSDLKGISGYLRNFLTTLSDIIGVHDNKYAEILFTMTGVVERATTTHTLVYNEILDSFSGWYDCLPTVYIKTYDRVISSIDDRLLWEHNKGNFGQWYGTYYPTILEVTVNGGDADDKESTKQFDTIEYQSEIYDVFGRDKDLETLHYISALNSYYTYIATGDIELVPIQTGYTLDTEAVRTDTYPLPAYTGNIRRRNRIWHTLIPRIRDTVDGDYRFRDNYIRLRLKYINTSKYRKLVLHDLTTYYNTLTKY